jgi:hypothetical protein
VTRGGRGLPEIRAMVLKARPGHDPAAKLGVRGCRGHAQRMVKGTEERVDPKTVVRRSLEWFRSSGVMRPPDGFWGVA